MRVFSISRLFKVNILYHINKETSKIYNLYVELLHKNAGPFFYDFIKLRDNEGELWPSIAIDFHLCHLCTYSDTVFRNLKHKPKILSCYG